MAETRVCGLGGWVGGWVSEWVGGWITCWMIVWVECEDGPSFHSIYGSYSNRPPR